MKPAELISGVYSPPRARRGDFAPLLASAAFLSGAFLWLYYPVLSWLIWRWRTDEYYSHGWLLPFLSLYLVWREREVLMAAWRAREYSLHAPWPGWALLCGGLVLQLGAAVADVNFVGAASIPIVLLGIARIVGGRGVARILCFPFLFLLAGVPLSGMLVQTLTVPMQNKAAGGAALLLGLLGVPILRDGVNLFTPKYHFLVAVPCSGLKTTITLFTLAILVSYILPDLKRLQRVILALLSLPIALFANTLRVTAIVLLGHYFGTEVAEGFLHNFSGLFLFALSFAALMGASHGLRAWWPHAESDVAVPPAPEVSGGAIADDAIRSTRASWRAPVFVAVLLVATRFLSLGAAGDDGASQNRKAAIANLQLPRAVDASMSTLANGDSVWRGTPVQVDAAVYEILHPDAAIQMRYDLKTQEPSTPAVSVQCIVIYSSNWKSLHSPVMCLRASGWEIASDETRGIGDQETINLLTGERRTTDGRLARTFLAYTFSDTHRAIGGWIPTVASAVGAKLLRQRSGAIEAQFAFDERALSTEGKIKPEVETLMRKVLSDVRRKLAAS